MKRGTIVKFSEAGLDWLYPSQGPAREKAKEKRFEFCGVNRNDLDTVRVKRMTSESYIYYHATFIEPA